MNKKLEPTVFSLSLALAIISTNFKALRFDSDIFWSIATGKWITVHKTVPWVDSFSWTISGRDWITHEWLYCFGAYNVFSVWGIIGLYMFTLLPMVLTIAVLYTIGKKADQNASYAFLLILTIGAIVLYNTALPLRAYIYALLFFATLVYLLYFTENIRCEFIYFALLFMLWSNLHISVCMGIVILVIEMIRRVVICNTNKYFLTIITSVMATLINPYGYKIWGYFWFTLTSMGDSKLISEWMAPNFNDPVLLLIYLVLASSIILLQFIDQKTLLASKIQSSQNADDQSESLKRPEWLGLFHIWPQFQMFAQQYFSSTVCLQVLFWGFYIYALYSVRMIFYTLILWVVLAAVLIGKNCHLDFRLQTNRILSLAFICFFLGNLWINNPALTTIFYSNKEVAPAEEVAFLKANPMYQNNLYNSYIYGGFLILNEIPVFIDARSDSYIKFGVFQTYGKIATLAGDPQALFEEAGVENVLETNDSPLCRYMYINRQWRLVHAGPYASIFTRIAD